MVCYGISGVVNYSHMIRFSDFVLLPLRPVFVTHKNPQRRKIIHGMRPVGRKNQSIDLNM